jgi:hypothetical protein
MKKIKVGIRCGKCKEVKDIEEVVIDAKINICRVCLKEERENGKEKTNTGVLDCLF